MGSFYEDLMKNQQIKNEVKKATKKTSVLSQYREAAEQSAAKGNSETKKTANAGSQKTGNNVGFWDAAKTIAKNWTAGVTESARAQANATGRHALKLSPEQQAANAYERAKSGTIAPIDDRTPEQIQLDEFMGISTTEYLANKAAREARNAEKQKIDNIIAKNGGAAPSYVDYGRKYEEGVEKETAQLGQTGQFLSGVARSMGAEVIPQTLKYIPVAGKALSPIAFFNNADQAAYEQAIAEGATEEEAELYGTVIGGIEAATEALGDVAGMALKEAKVIDAPLEAISKTVFGDVLQNKAVNNILTVLGSAMGEGAEEVLSDLVSPFAKGIYNDKSGAENWKDDVTIRQLWQDFLAGAITGGLMKTASGITRGEFRAQNEVLASETMRKAFEEQKNAEKGEKKAARNAAANKYAEMLDYVRGREKGTTAKSAVQSYERESEIDAKLEELIAKRAEETGKTVEEVRAETEKLRAVAMSANSEQRINSLAEQIAQKENITIEEAKQRLTDMGVSVNEQNENSDGSAERNAVLGADRQSGEAAEGVEAQVGNAAANDQRRTAADRANRVQNIREVGTETLIKAGTNRPSVRVFSQDMYDDEMRTWEQRARERGYQVTYVAGQIEGYDHGKLVSGRGVIEGKRIIIQADNVNYSIEQIMEHELGHSEETAELNAEAEKLIRERFSEEEFMETFHTYQYYLEGYSDESILSEIIQDARAGINAFGKNLEQYKDTAREVYDRAYGRDRGNAVSREANGERETRGPSWSTEKQNEENQSGKKVKELKKGEGRPYYDETENVIYLYDNNAKKITRGTAIKSAAEESVSLYGENSPFSEGFLNRIKNDENEIEDVSFEVIDELKGITRKNVFETVRDSDEIFRGNASNKQTGMQIFVGAEGIEDTGIYAERKNAIDQAKALSGIDLLIENAQLIGTSETKIDISKKLRKRNNPQRLFQYIFATPFNMGNGRKIAIIRVDALYTGEKNTLNKFYNLNSVEIIGASSNAAYSGFQAGQALESAPAITIAEMVSLVKPEVVGNHVNLEEETAKFSRGEADADGNDLSEKQAEYFSRSKVRDADGKLIPMYHGTNGDFTVFNQRLFGGKNGTQEGYGIYLTSSREVAGSYGERLISGYANIEKPARSDRKTIRSGTLEKLIRATCEAQAERMAEEDGYGSKSEALLDTWISNYTDTYSQPINMSYREVARSIIDSQESDMDIIQEVMGGMAIRDYADAYDFYDILKEVTGIDGFITTWENKENPDKPAVIAIAFDSNQFKNADNKNPTGKEDIRWSRGETVGQLTETEAEMLENASAAMEEENRQTLMNGAYRYEMVLGQKGDKIRAVIQVFENRDGNRTPVFGDQQTFDTREEAVKWLTDSAAEHMIKTHGNKMTFASIVENRTMTREEATAMAEENDYPMLRDKNGEEHRVVPEWTWVQNDNGQYGIVIGVDDMGQLTVLYENKRKGTQKTVTGTVQGLGITYVDGQYSEDQGFTEAIRAEQDAEADASAEPDNWTPTEEEQRVADALTEEAEELTNAEQEAEEKPMSPEEQNARMLERLFGATPEQRAGRKTDITPEMAEAIEGAIVDGYIRNAEKTTAEAPKEEKTGEVSTEVILPGEKSKIRKAWEAFKRLMDNTADSIHQIALKTGNKSLDGYFFHALAYKQRGADWIQKKRTNTMGANKGKSLNEILNPIRKKGNQYYIDFQNFLYHRLNIERMSRDVAKERAEAQRYLNDLARKNPNLATMTDERLKDLAAQYHAGNYDISEDAQMQLYSDYWEAKKRVKRMEDRRNKPIFGGEVTAEKSKAVVENLLKKHPEFAELAEEVYAYTRDLLQYRVDSGMISQKDADALLNTYKYYVPVAYNVSYEAAMQNGGITVSTTVKKAKGNYGGAQLLPLHTAMARQTMSVMRNSGIQRLANALAKQYKADRKALTKGEITAEEFEARWGDEILSIRESEAVWDEDLADNDDTAKQGNNVLTFIQDGKRYDMIMGKGMTAAMESLKPGAGHLEGPGILAGMVSAFKRVTTSLRPIFMITNPIKDVQDAVFYSTDLKRWAINYPKAKMEIWKKSGKYWDLYQAMGGVYSSFFNYATGEFEDEKIPKTKAGEAYKKAKQKIEMLNQDVEMAPRLAEFMTVLQNKSKDGNWTEADLMEAFEAAQDITTNFARSGSLGKIINRYFVPFWNPGVQGLSKAVRTVTETKGFKSWAMLAMKAAALGIAPTVINALVYRDDDEWDDIEDSVKANYWLFKSKDGIWIKIPKGRVIGAISTLATGVTEAARGDDVKVGELAKTAVGNIAPSNPLETSIFSTAFRVGLLDKDSPGKNWYGGDIESQRLRNYAPGKRYDESTDYISKWIGGKLDISPKKLNYLLVQYSGVIGDIVLPYLTPKAERRIKNIPLSEPFAAKFTLDTASSNKVSGDFYDYSDELQYRKNEGGAADVLTNQYFSRMSGDVSDLYARVREIENDKVLKDKEKSALVRELRKEITKKQKEIMETADRYSTVAAKYIKDNPQLDYTDKQAVAVWTEEYNARQSKDDYRITEEKAADKMKAVLYREINREALGAEYALEVYSTDVYLKAAALNESVKLSYDDFYDYYFSQLDLHADYDEEGKSISGSKKDKVVALIDSMDITDEQKDALLASAGYKPNDIKWSSGNKAKGEDGKSGGGKGRGRSGSAKAPKVKELDLPKYKDVIQAGMKYDPNATTAKKSIAHYEPIKFDPFPKVKTADEIRRDKKAYVEYWKNKKF